MPSVRCDKRRRVEASLRSPVMRAPFVLDRFMTVAVRPREEGDEVTSPTYVDKAAIIATLRSRGLHARADWVDRELPALVDTYSNAALLRNLDIDPAAMAPSHPDTAASEQ